MVKSWAMRFLMILAFPLWNLIMLPFAVLFALHDGFFEYMAQFGVTPNDIRHAAASEMLAAGADLAAVAAQMGHASIQTTATTYTHVTPGGQKRAADLLPRLVQFGAEKSPHDDS